MINRRHRRGSAIAVVGVLLLLVGAVGGCSSTVPEESRSSVTTEPGAGAVPDQVLEPGDAGVFVAGAEVNGHGIVLATLDQLPADDRFGTSPVPQVASIGYGVGRIVTTWIRSLDETSVLGGRLVLEVPNATVRGRPAVVAQFEGGRSVSWTVSGDDVPISASISVATIDPTVDVVALAESSWSISPDSFRILRSRTAALAVVARMGGPIDDGTWLLEATVPPSIPVRDFGGPTACAGLSFGSTPAGGGNDDRQLLPPFELCMAVRGIPSLTQVVIAGRGYAFGVVASTAESFRLIADRDPAMPVDLPMEVLRSDSAPDLRWLIVPLPIEAIPCMIVRDSNGTSFSVGDPFEQPLGACDR